MGVLLILKKSSDFEDEKSPSELFGF